ncbi:MAG TPA: sugar ABC transporter permease [Clostridiaceae bacterium]|nr:sugar ABC transporter permease [Clostridiaceae bacterium]
MKKMQISMGKKKIIEAYIFMLPFIIGIVAFFAFPLFVSIKLSFGKVIDMSGFKIKWIGFDNYIRAFVTDVQFIPMFLRIVRESLLKLPLILVFSLMLAMFISNDIKFKAFFRIAFFLPFLLGTGYVMQQIIGQGINEQVLMQAKNIFIPEKILAYLGPNVDEAVNSFFGVIVTVLWSCGVQILLFLSSLQGISKSLYESAKVDGATQWEMFWKITLPMISPVMLLNIIYTLLDSFTDISNPILSYIQDYAFTRTDFAYAAAIGWIYFIFIMILILVIFMIMKNHLYSFDMKEETKNGKSR